MSIPLRTPEEIESIARAARLVWDALGELLIACVPGVTILELDDLAAFVRNNAPEPCERTQSQRECHALDPKLDGLVGARFGDASHPGQPQRSDDSHTATTKRRRNMHMLAVAVQHACRTNRYFRWPFQLF